jgi:cytochrome c-type biogenesis protein
MDISQLSFGVAFLAGVTSFLSPCVLPLVPLYLAQLVGHNVYQSATGQGKRSARLTTFLHSLLFVLGFTPTFVAFGATASVLGSFLRSYQLFLRQIGGILLIIIGLHLMGVLQWPIFSWQRHVPLRPHRPGYPASLLIGCIFAIGWTPCIGLVLGPILGLAASAVTLRQGVLLLLCYSLGLGLPFLLLGVGLDQFIRILQWLRPYTGKIEIATGVVMVVTGVIIFFNFLPSFNHYFNLGLNS